MTKHRIDSVTVGLPVAKLETAINWYRQLLGELEEEDPHPGVWEIQVAPSCWLQLWEQETAGTNTGIVRFEAKDIEAAHRHASSIAVDVGHIDTVPGAVRYFDFRDPFGNSLSYYELLV